MPILNCCVDHFIISFGTASSAQYICESNSSQMSLIHSLLISYLPAETT